jgi:SAM-dependent methyltransferase
MKDLKRYFDKIAPERREWKKRNDYYHESIEAFFRFLVPEKQKVLELGSGTGELLACLKPSYGVGIDISANMTALAKEAFPDVDFRQGNAEDPSTWNEQGTFDYIIMSDLVGHLEDIQQTFENLKPFCENHTRIIVSYYNFLWEPIIKSAERLKLKTPTNTGNWLSPEDIGNLFFLAGFDAIKEERRLIFPKKIPLLHGIIEFVGSLPLINRLCLCNFIVARPLEEKASAEKSVSVVIPCKNEKGNIENAVKRLPDVGSHTEVIFIDGHSTDGTPDEIRRVTGAYPEKDIKFMVQDGTGKGDAVRKAFEHAKGDILMILDADLTVPPEELPKFYNAVASGKGEFINGSRLVYPMEDQAMRFLNMMGNKFFSLAFSWLLNQRIKDTLCGTKVLSRENYQAIAANRTYFGDFDPFGDFDLLFGASKLNLKIIEIPIRYRARQYGETQISRFKHGLLLMKMCVFAIRRLNVF